MTDRKQQLRELEKAVQLTPQTRGHRFEEWLSACFADDGLEPRLRYVASGEQIDGSLVFNGRTHLVEAKWWSSRVPASDIYAFKGKVDGKLVGTIGFFLSMSGYGEDAIDALRAGKSVNVLLFDRNDIDAAADVGFPAVFAHKLRAASEKGEVFYPSTGVAGGAKGDSHEHGPRRVALTQLEVLPEEFPLAIVVEGVDDEVVLHPLIARVFNRERVVRPFIVVSAGGRAGLANLATYAGFPRVQQVVIVANADTGGDRFAQEIQVDKPPEYDVDVILIPGGVDRWLGEPPDGQRWQLDERVPRAQEMNLEVLEEDPQFRRFKGILLRDPR